MYYWRVTKYNPIYRDDKGRYTKNEWTSIGDIGKFYEGEELTYDKYVAIEKLYIEAVILAMTEANIEYFKITGLEKRRYTINDNVSITTTKMFYKSLKDNIHVSIDDITILVKLILREIVWVRLESDILNIHFGYDYYMYFCSKKRLKKTEKIIKEKGLFVENFKSPYIEYED